MRALTRRYLPYPGHQQRSRRIARGTTLAGRGTWPIGSLVPELHATVPDSLLASGVGEVPSPDLPTSAAGSWGAEQEALERPMLRSSASCWIGPTATS